MGPLAVSLGPLEEWPERLTSAPLSSLLSTCFYVISFILWMPECYTISVHPVALGI